MPRTHRAIPLEEAFWKEVHRVLTNPDHLIGIASEYLSNLTTQAESEDERRELLVELDRLDRQETRLVRGLAD